MVDFINRNVTSAAQTASYDMGLRAYMLKVYNYMALALVLTGVVAFFAAHSPVVVNALYSVDASGRPVGFNLLGIIVAFSPLALVLFLGFRLNNMSFQAAQTTFWVYAGLTGLSLSSVFLLYTDSSIARVFFITAAVFGGMSLYGYTTKRDLTGMGSFLIMGVWGILLASIVNMFLKSSGLSFALSILGVVIFVGLTAYDTQKIKNTYYQFEGAGEEVQGKSAIMGALNLYIDFIAIFVHLMRFMGERR